MLKRIKKVILNIRIILGVFKSAYSMKRFVSGIDKCSKKDLSNKDYIIVVQSLYMIAWPLYMMVLGYMLHKKGIRVAFLFDETNFEKSIIYYKIKIRIIKYFLSVLEEKGYKVYKLPTNTKDMLSSIITHEQLSSLAEMQSVWLMKGESMKGKRESIHREYFSKLDQAAKKLDVFFESIKCDRVIVAGGILATANLYIRYCNYLNIPISTVDCGAGRSLISNSGVAAQLTDIPIAFELLENENKQLIKKIAFEHLSKRTNGTDKFKYQSKKIDSTEEVSADIVLLLNSVWDQAALGLHTIYPSTNEWIVSTVQWVLENTNSSIAVRQHPAEKNKYASTIDNYEELLKQYSSNNRFTFISAYNEQNTYELIKKSKMVICYSTTTALEAIMLGKPVVTVSNCYYSKQKFVFNPLTLDEYYTFIVKGVDNKLIVPEEEIDNASTFYYLSQECNWIFTDFNACGYNKWIQLDSDSICELPGVDGMLKSLIEGTPHAIIEHKKLMAKYWQKSDSNKNKGKK